MTPDEVCGMTIDAANFLIQGRADLLAAAREQADRQTPPPRAPTRGRSPGTQTHRIGSMDELTDLLRKPS